MNFILYLPRKDIKIDKGNDFSNPNCAACRCTNYTYIFKMIWKLIVICYTYAIRFSAFLYYILFTNVMKLPVIKASKFRENESFPICRL